MKVKEIYIEGGLKVGSRWPVEELNPEGWEIIKDMKGDYIVTKIDKENNEIEVSWKPWGPLN